MLTRRQNALLFGAALLALLVRGLHLWGQARNNPLFDVPLMDAEVHHAWARRIASGGGMEALPFFRAPLYPYALASIYAVFGSDPIWGRLFGCGLGSLTAYLVGRLGAALVDFRTGLLAAGIVALYWPLVYFDVELLSVALENALGTGMLLALITAVRKPSRLRFFFGGLLFGLAAITRPTVLVLAAAFPLFAWLEASPPRRQLRALAACAWIAVGATAAIAPVTLRNAWVGGEWVPIATNGGLNFYIGNNPESNGYSALLPGTRPSVEGVYEQSHRRAEADLERPLTRTEASSYWFGRGLDWARNEPGAFAAHMLRKLGLVFAPVEIPNNMPIQFFARYSPVGALSWAGFPLLLCMGGMGLALIGPEGARRWLLPLAYVATIVATTTLFFAPARFRAPLVPVLAIAAATAVWRLPGVLAARDVRRIAAVAAALVVALLAMVASPIDGAAVLRMDGAFGHNRVGWRELMEDRKETADLAGARAHLLRSYELAPDFLPKDVARGLYKVGVRLLQSGRFEEAAEVMQRAVEIAPVARPHYLDALAAALAASGDPAAAVTIAERGRELARAEGNKAVEARIARRLEGYRKAAVEAPEPDIP